jgi:hypothetical protein
MPNTRGATSTALPFYELRGQHDRAVTAFETALKLDPHLAAAASVRKIPAALAAKPVAAKAPTPSVPPAPPTHPVALVIGASGYRAVPALRNPRRDAAAVADALRQTGFQSVETRTGSRPRRHGEGAAKFPDNDFKSQTSHPPPGFEPRRHSSTLIGSPAMTGWKVVR